MYDHDSKDPGRLAFALRGCRDLLEKLRCETGSLNTIERHDVMGRAYIAFNCAVTAWHMTDWAWAELNQKQREEVQKLAKTSFDLVPTNPKPLQKYVRCSSHALKLCELIANGSKHCVLRDPDPRVRTTMTDGDGTDYGNPVVNDDGKEVLMVWLPEPPFVPEGDGDGPPFPLNRRSDPI
jgi:hypothetical protein